MASQRQIKSRIRSVKNTKQITKAMQMVAASKMRRAQEATKGSMPYSLAANELLTYIARQGATRGHKWFTERPVKSRLIIVIAADKGLAGAYNSNVLKAYLGQVKSDRTANITTKTIAVGRRAAQFATRIKDIDVVGIYEDLLDRPDGSQFHTMLSMAKDLFESGDVDTVDVVYTQFISSLSQIATSTRLFPAGFVESDVSSTISEAEFEPSVEGVLDDVAFRLIGARLYQGLLDARASEHSMRMIAMKNASENASSLVDDLTLEMNKARQAAITQELGEISAGVEAMK